MGWLVLTQCTRYLYLWLWALGRGWGCCTDWSKIYLREVWLASWLASWGVACLLEVWFACWGLACLLEVWLAYWMRGGGVISLS
jgi:hypothetical protein